MTFPSNQFYDGQLKCGDMSQLFKAELPIWPGGPRRPIVFCHLEGYERSLTVSAAEGGQDSKSNMDEVDYMVNVYIYLFLCQKCVIQI